MSFVWTKLCLAIILYCGQLISTNDVKELKAEVTQLKQTLEALSRQVMLQQFFTEEKLRSDGFSGIKQVRTTEGGSKNYFSNSHSGSAFGAIHDHANNIRTVGMGEFIGVLNGVEFRTRHNDYRLNQPHSTSSKYHAIEPIAFPDVPEEVLSQPNVSAQIQEMREWFKAWKHSNHSVRDYRKYFQPVLCYLEGAWTTKRGESIEEPFKSDRHFIDASSWFDLQEKVRFTSYTGTKSLSENLAFLPTTIMGMRNGSTPLFAQWNYRILCHKLKTHVPLTKLRPVEDVASRMIKKLDMDKYKMSRAARFELDLDTDPTSTKFQEKRLKNNFLDILMEEIPGKNNYAGHLYDGGFDANVMKMDGSAKKDVSRYHRWFKLKKKDAMGRQESHRGYTDQFLFAAKTTQERVAGIKIEMCQKNKKTKTRDCMLRDEKWSYAIPLEIIYLTPLTKWNPLDIQIKSKCRRRPRKVRLTRVGKGLCNDKKKARKACPKFYYITPNQFFSGQLSNTDPADTANNGGWCMIDKNNNGVSARATGTRIFFPEIPGIGKLRQRFPIAPVHGEGNPIWKNVNALADIVLNEKTYEFMKNPKQLPLRYPLRFELPMSVYNDDRPPHNHFFTLMSSEMQEIMRGSSVVTTTNSRQGHSHTIKVRYNDQTKEFYYSKCDGLRICFDGHPNPLTQVDP